MLLRIVAIAFVVLKTPQYKAAQTLKLQTTIPLLILMTGVVV
jgi:hypothetical protein